jgi:hypothetical protein
MVRSWEPKMVLRREDTLHCRFLDTQSKVHSPPVHKSFLVSVQSTRTTCIYTVYQISRLFGIRVCRNRCPRIAFCKSDYKLPDRCQRMLRPRSAETFSIDSTGVCLASVMGRKGDWRYETSVHKTAKSRNGMVGTFFQK